MRRVLCVLLLAACLFLAGCRGLPAPREMEDMALLRAMGVDQAGEELLLTVTAGSGQEDGKDKGQALVLSARGSSLSAAALSLQGCSDRAVYFGYVDQLLLGEGLARRGVRPVLDYFARDTDLGLGARLWVARGSSGEEALNSDGREGAAWRLATLRSDGEMGAAVISRTAGEVYADLLELGCAYAPALSVSQREEASLTGGGYAVLREDQLVGFLDGEEARGLELLAGRPSDHVLAVELSGGRAVVRLTGGSALCRFSRDGRLVIRCRATARLAEYGAPLTEGERDLVRMALEEREYARTRSAMALLRSWETDCLGLGEKAALSAPGRWSAWKEDWPRRFGAMEPELIVTVKLQQ